MDFMFKIPRWWLCGGLVITLFLFTALIIGEIQYDYGAQRPLLFQMTYEYPRIIFVTTLLILLFVFVWFTAVIVHYCQNYLRNWLPLIPAIISLLFQIGFLAFIIEEFTAINLLPRAIKRQFTNNLMFEGNGEILIAGLTCSLVTVIMATIFIIKVTKQRQRDWFLIPFSVLFLPFGILWLQPKLERMLIRPPVKAPTDHFVI